MMLSLGNGMYTNIDESCLHYISHIRWYASYSKTNNKYYVVSHDGIRLHRYLLKVDDSKIEVDHINGDTLDNRIKNLRACSKSENQRNRGKTSLNKSGYKGVSWHKSSNSWVSQIQVNKKKFHLGCFSCKLEAAKAYNKAAKKYHGEFAYVNKIR